MFAPVTSTFSNSGNYGGFRRVEEWGGCEVGCFNFKAFTTLIDCATPSTSAVMILSGESTCLFALEVSQHIAGLIFPCSIKRVDTLLVCSLFIDWSGRLKVQSQRMASWISRSMLLSDHRSFLLSKTRLISRKRLTERSCCKITELNMMIHSEGKESRMRRFTSLQSRLMFLCPQTPLGRSKCLPDN